MMRFVSALSAFILIGCDVTPLIKDERVGTEPRASWRQSREGISIAFDMTPEMPGQGQEAGIRLTIHDVSTQPALPVMGATIVAIAAMSSLPGHVLELTPESSPTEPGVYHARASFDAKGEWLAKILARLPSGRRITAEFPFRVR